MRFYDGGGTRTGLGSFPGHSIGDLCIRGKKFECWTVAGYREK